MEKELLTVDEVSALLRVKPPRVCELVRQKLLPAIRLGRQIRIDKAKLEEFLENGGRALPGGWRRKAS